MNLEDLQKKLLAAARSNPPEDRVPYAFEKRILARLTAQSVDGSALWARALWRAAIPCVGVTLLMATLSFTMVSTESTTTVTDDDVSQQFELALLAPANQLEEFQ